MGKIIFYVLIIVGLCFGQGIWLKENPKITLPIPINVAIRSEEGVNEIAMRKFSLYSLQTLSLISPLYPNTLIMQVEGETLQPKTSFWKQAGIYGLEFLGAGISATICAGMATISIMDEGDVAYWHPERWPFVYVGGNLLITSSLTWVVGKLLGQKGAWWKTAIGAGVGSITGSVIIMIDEKDGQSSDLPWLVGLSATALGSVVGFNF